MADNNYYQGLLSRVSKRSVESTVSMLGITDKGLRAHLISQLSKENSGDGFLSDPVFESMFPWEAGDTTMDALAGDLLLPSLVDAMDKAGEHRFNRSWCPFKHQIKAWKTLINEPQKSLVVTSGTGSGKTECFMVPILNDLAEEYEQAGVPLVGVRALFLYPLNALISSQRERFRAWTDAYDDGLRFCLYNGNTEENKHKDQGKYANEVLTRRGMRLQPAPMLVTNATMLEYMLVRQVDEPIVAQSQGKLRWIVLDEAHTYMGSQAAELSLLLRRVMHTFGVGPADVRFVATSATIGASEADEQLRKYLADLAGIDINQVVVVGGKRDVPPLKDLPPGNATAEDIKLIDEGVVDSDERFKALCRNPKALTLRMHLTSNMFPSRLTELSKRIFGDELRTNEVLKWLDLCSSTAGTCSSEHESAPFLPVRGHIFHQVLSGLWCCVDKSCGLKKGTPLEKNWPFGHVSTTRAKNCKCGAPVYELLFCNDCNTPHLLTLQKDGALFQMERESIDEFSLDYESSDDESKELPESHQDQVVIAPYLHPEGTYTVSIDQHGNQVPQGMESYDINVIRPLEQFCSHCESSGYKNSNFYRRCILGAPFYISNAVPSLLEACQESDDASERPYRGRRLITFTDSRQGTARISTKIQQDSERDSIRGLTYSSVANNVFKGDPEEIKNKKNKLEKFEKRILFLRKDDDNDFADEIEEMAEKLRAELSLCGLARPLSWSEAIAKFHTSTEIGRWIFNYYKELNPSLFTEGNGSKVLVEMLLLREFARRPKRQNSLETLGLVSVQYPVIQHISKLPEVCKSLGMTLNDWQAFLKVVLDFYVRENSIIDIPEDWINWMGAKIYAKAVVKPDSLEPTNSRLLRWPQVVAGRSNRLIRLLVMAYDLDISKSDVKNRVNGVLEETWKALTKQYTMENIETGLPEVRQVLKNKPGSVHYHLDRKEIAFQACRELWVCPITHRLLDNVFKCLTPYLPFNGSKEEAQCRQAQTSICQLDASDFNSDADRVQSIRNWVEEQENIKELRAENLWTDVSDRIVEGGRFFRAAEHSAQQPARVLDEFERDFKAGRLNVLSCSTTMEMGVDIGGISVVAMNNVPPHPANYLQRAGRAGRRRESQALAFTICKDNPHERAVFSNPTWPFTTAISAPYIALNSERIILRHINALLMAHFLKSIIIVNETAVTSLNCEWFFSAQADEEAPVDRMLRWLESIYISGLPEKLQQGLNSIIRGSILAGFSSPQLVKKAVESLSNMKDQWLPAFVKLRMQANNVSHLSEKDPLRRKVEYDLRCMGEQYLLSELAAKAFLPGYGFPTGIVTFDHYSVSDFKKGKYVKSNGRIDNLARLRERPGRQMALAIREYAPGTDVVLNGLVYKSAGILTNKFSPDEDYSEPQRLMKEWRCGSCGHIGNESGATFNELCTECGTELKADNIREYIVPSGFAVEFYSEPSTDISSQTFIPVEEPWVTANAPFYPLFDPRLGACRVSSEGHIFHHSSGENGKGYAVCLRCGRSESMTIDGDYPHNLQPGRSHTKLQGKQGEDSLSQCEGPDEAYAIKGSIHLGATDQTDVCELYFKIPSQGVYLRHRVGDQLPWTLAVALRRALADVHGVGADEMGYTVKATTIPDCNYPVAAVVLYDVNGGGSGFASSAGRYLKDILKSAAKHLECEDDCDSACQRCLLGFDTRFHSEVLNRHLALDYLRSIEPYLLVADEAKVFGDATEYCFETLAEELLSAARAGVNNLQLFVSGEYGKWDISVSSLKEHCLTWKGLFETVGLVLPSNNLGGISDVHKEDLRALGNFGIALNIATGGVPKLAKTGALLLQLSGDSTCYSIATTAKEANVPGIHWHQLADSYLIKTQSVDAIPIKPIDLRLIAVGGSSGDIELDISNQCNGLVRDFGEKLWCAIRRGAIGLSEVLDSEVKLESIQYSDTYVTSPWNLMLFAELIDGLRSEAGDQWQSPSLSLLTGNLPPNRSAKGLYAEWSDPSEKAAVIEEYFEQMGETLSVELKTNREIAHGRVLTLTWVNGVKYTVRLDHGFGCWSLDGKPSKWFDLVGDPQAQVAELFDIQRTLKVKFSKNFPTQVFVKRVSS